MVFGSLVVGSLTTFGSFAGTGGYLDCHAAHSDPEQPSRDAAITDFVGWVHVVRVVNHVLLEGAPYLLPIAEYLCLDMI